jgi:hypothetical protein
VKPIAVSFAVGVAIDAFVVFKIKFFILRNGPL